MNIRLLDDSSLLEENAANEIVARASMINCECPKHLVAILHEIRKLQAYEKKCAADSEKDRAIHEWLYTSAKNLDQMLSGTIVQLARMEGMIDDENQIVDHPSKK